MPFDDGFITTLLAVRHSNKQKSLILLTVSHKRRQVYTICKIPNFEQLNTRLSYKAPKVKIEGVCSINLQLMFRFFEKMLVKEQSSI